jgi:phospholipase A1/A2
VPPISAARRHKVGRGPLTDSVAAGTLGDMVSSTVDRSSRAGSMAAARRAPRGPWRLGAIGAAVLGAILCTAPVAQTVGPAAAPAPAVTPAWPAALVACAQRRSDVERLACYDAAAREAGVQALPASSGPERALALPAWGSGALPAAPPAGGLVPGGYLSSFWELDADRKRGTFNFIGYRPNYFLPLHVTSRVNRRPSSPNPQNAAPDLPAYRNVEAKIQLSIRTKIIQGLLLPGADLWFAYSQQSRWQLYSTQISAPFRSTDHEPEVVYVVPLPAELPGGWRLRMGGLGLAHQSNGQALPLSRSWNRVYALAGLENGEFSLVARLQQRLDEPAETDDNPDLVAFRGRLDLLAAWTPGLATATLQWRTNLDRRGSLQADWTFPVDSAKPGGLRYYVQAFTGYAESLLDYNHRQSSIGAGVTLFGW